MLQVYVCAHVWRSEESFSSNACPIPDRVSHWTCCPLCPHPLLACSDESPEILLFLLLVLPPKPFLLPGIEVWEATLTFYMDPRVPNLCNKHSYLLCCFPSPKLQKNKLAWWGTSVIQALGKQRQEDIYKFEVSLIYLAGSWTTGPISKKQQKLNE